MAKTRSTRAKKRTTTTTRRRSPAKKQSNPILFFDIVGIVLIGLGLTTLVALCAEKTSGVFGSYVAAAMHVTVGVGAWIIPFLIALMGVMFIVGPLKIVPKHIATGSVLLFLTIVTWASLAANIPKEIVAGGGYLGNALAIVLRKITGDTIGYIILSVSALVAVVIIANVPLSNLIAKVRAIWLEWQDATAERAAALEESRAKKAKTEKPKVNINESEDDPRKRTLGNIFGRGKNGEQAEEVEAVPVVEQPKPPVKINDGMTPRFEKSKTGDKTPEVLFNLKTGEQGEFKLPPTSLLIDPPPPPPRVESELKANIEIIERTLSEFKVDASVVEIAHGPTVARYEIRLAPGIKVNKIVTLADNLAMQLAAIAVRVEAPIPGKPAIGVEVPNRERGMVVLKEVIESKQFREAPSKLMFALGKDVSGQALSTDLYNMPHLMIGGSTGSGKSVGLSALITSLLFRATPDELKFVLIDPKRVELTLFDGIPHLACPVVKDVKQAAGVFRAVVQEMDRRYDSLNRVGARKINIYNEKVKPEERLPYMVVVVDELADLMMQCAAEVEGSITRLAQLARAVGIHLVIATQRPSVDVITGIIKANIPSRIAFGVSSHHDSRTILDQKGAENLVGRGDMLFLPMDANKPVRIQGCYVSEKEIESVCEFLKEQRMPNYTLTPVSPSATGVSGGGGGDDGTGDEFYEPSVRFVASTGYCSTSMLQRKFKIGYTRAARIVDVMEQQGIVGALDGAKPRQVLINKADIDSLFGGTHGFAPDVNADIEDEYDDEVPPAEIIMPDAEDDDEEVA